MNIAYGAWPSPISTDLVTAGSLRLGGPLLDGGSIYWVEGRPDEAGRVSLWRRSSAGETREVTPPGTYVRNAVHEYGGGAWHVRAGVAVWTSHPGGAIWLRVGDDAPRQLSDETPRWRYGDLRVHPDRGLLLAVREEHREQGEAVNTIVSLSLDGKAANAAGGTVLCAGADFYSDPELSADGRLAWVQWDHPAMPWDATTLRVAALREGTVETATTVAGGPEESALHPRWLPDGGLVFCSDRSDWWNLYAWRNGQVRALHPLAAEFCGPPWVLGQQPYTTDENGHVVCRWSTADGDRLGVLDVASGDLEVLAAPGMSYGDVSVAAGQLAVLVGSPTEPTSIQLKTLGLRSAGGGDDWATVRRASDRHLPEGIVSGPEAVTWPGREGAVHGWFYAPTNPEVTADEAERPPLIVTIHGGPTSAARTGLDLDVQYWTSRGFAVLGVDYSGSTGYGRAYRTRLRGRWGELDVTDCATGAQAMADQGRVDRDRMAIMGGSAGGYTVLRALTITDDFAAGVSLYGVGDLIALATDTHKFESRYLDGLIGPYPADAATYRDRSPINHVEDLSSPILLLQGGEDKVVPLNQAEAFAAAARVNGLPVALIVFPDEGHGFRKAANIAATLQATLYFLGRVFGFEPADELPPIQIENLPRPR
ncbi:MAG: prolyl oligopeptidase family serine peptidase [Propionibacteriaceae bacterium]